LTNSLTNSQSFVSGFRDSAPYINALRGRTLVISFGGEAVADSATFPHFIHDIALLNSLGIRLVLVHGSRPQIEHLLRKHKIESTYCNNLRITNTATLDCVKHAVGNVRVEIEALLSMGLANSPMAGAKIRVTSGNYITAKPIGIIDGIDYDHTGQVRGVDVNSINSHLNNGEIILLSPIGYSSTGEIFNINAEDVASAAAIALKADKLIYLIEDKGICNAQNKIITELALSEAEALLCKKLNKRSNKKPAKNTPNKITKSSIRTAYLEKAVHACRENIKRVHIIDRHIDGALIQELFTRDGIGTLISIDTYEGLRQANINDVGGILELITPIEENGALVRRSRDRLELEINHFSVIERDGAVIACSALYPFIKESTAELACLAVHSDYRNAGRANILLEHIERQAKEMGIKKLFVLTTQATHWFREKGFRKTDIDTIPVKRKAMYNYQRNSKIYVKQM